MICRIFAQFLYLALGTNKRHLGTTLQQVLAHFLLSSHQLCRATVKYTWPSGILFAGFNVSERVVVHESSSALLGTLELVEGELVPNDVAHLFLLAEVILTSWHGTGDGLPFQLFWINPTFETLLINEFVANLALSGLLNNICTHLAHEIEIHSRWFNYEFFEQIVIHFTVHNINRHNFLNLNVVELLVGVKFLTVQRGSLNRLRGKNHFICMFLKDLFYMDVRQRWDFTFFLIMDFYPMEWLVWSRLRVESLPDFCE